MQVVISVLKSLVYTFRYRNRFISLKEGDSSIYKTMKPLLSLNRGENAVQIAALLFSTLKVKVTDKIIRDILLDHPNYPSLLSVGDLLSTFKIKYAALIVPPVNIEKIPTPFIAQIRERDQMQEYFTLVRSVGQKGVRYFDPEQHRWRLVSREEFLKKWPSGVVMTTDAVGATPEIDYRRNRINELVEYTGKLLSIWLIPLIAIVSMLATLEKMGLKSLTAIGFFLLTLTGSVISGFLLLIDIGESNTLIRQLCASGIKVNCLAVLRSKSAKIAGISWTAIGFTYFAGSVLSSLFLGITNPAALAALSWINALAVPYIFFSVYYQWQVAKQWCTMCLMIQGILALQLVVALIGGWHHTMTIRSLASQTVIIPLVSAYILPAIVLNYILMAYREAKKENHSATQLRQIKNDPIVFKALLSKQKTFSSPSNGLGITLGNRNAGVRITKICNPYCKPCGTTHSQLEELLEEIPDLQIQIIFTASNDESDPRKFPVRHFMAIAETNDEALIRRSLDRWYLAEDKNYETFARSFPVDGRLMNQDAKIEAMHEWCQSNNIDFTPIVYVNGHQLPEQYSVADLKYFLSV